MSTSWSRVRPILHCFSKRKISNIAPIIHNPGKYSSAHFSLTVAAISGLTCYAWLKKNHSSWGTVFALKKHDHLETAVLKLTGREKRFIKFASVEHVGQLYMTTQDFIESITEAEPRPRLKRRTLRKRDLDELYAVTPRASKGSHHMFRDLHDKAIISYTEYLFLLSVLTKPATGFHIAFNMFDTDGNERVSRSEFLVLEQIFSHARKERRGTAAVTDAEGNERDVEDDILQHKNKVNTTLLVHFFGPKGDHELSFEEFRKFMENLQEEILEIEFQEFARGYHKISEVEFAKILLRYTYLRPDQYDMYIDRLVERMDGASLLGISFKEFRDFCSFLNQLEDFAIAMRMYTMADQPISQEEFNRAVFICTGEKLSEHVVNTVFCIFDDDGDGQLSYKEFIGFMKERKQRGFKTSSRLSGLQAFKDCVKQEMRTPN